ncbi:hypothetical protein BJV78DRAFT_1166160 [Lactifluus subvellereus]|nr:hypothetical protein BJV78DRAFT_1166160 [Lactifluus subvellereus]
MTKPIILWQSERTLSTDDAGLTILGSVSPPKAYFQPGPYYDQDINISDPTEPLRVLNLPPLSYFCIKRLVKIPELVYLYGPPRPYRFPTSPSDTDILQALIPSNLQGHFDLGKVDPRLWAVIVQVYSDLPHRLLIYRTALSDKYTPLLQHIPATEHFSLLTVLELPGCSHLNDDTIIQLTVLHTLCALDASSSALSAQGIRRLSGTLKWDEDGVDIANQRRGPWQLRILSLRNCKRVTNAIYQYLGPFILLAAVDLRGTSCTWEREKIPHLSFLLPVEALSLLSSARGLLPSSNFAFLHIDHLTHTARDSYRVLANPSNVMLEESNTTSPAHHGASYASNPSALPCLSEWALSFPRPSPLRQVDEGLPMGAAADLEVAMRTMDAVVAAESEAHTAQYKARMFYSQRTTSTSPSKAHPPRKMPQWGQELLMLYREPPPWSQGQLPRIIRAAPKSRSLEEVAAVKRTDEHAMKGVQKMQELLAERHRSTKKETNTSCDNSKGQTRLVAPRNPFAIAFDELSAHVHARTAERTSAQSCTDAVTKSIMAAPPKSLASLKPISSLPVPIPPDPQPVRRDPRRSHDSSLNCRPASLQARDPCGQRADRMVGSTTNRRRPVLRTGADPAAENKRGRAAASSAGSKKQKHGEPGFGGGFDWSSWSAPP